MPDYSFKAVSQTGKIKTGVQFATSVNELRANLRQAGFSLLKANKGKSLEDILNFFKSFQLGSFSRSQTIEFSYNMGIMLKAGVPMISTLEELREDAGDTYTKKLIENILENISAGDTLHQALSKRPKDFSKLFLGLIRIGEETGNLNEIFFNIAKHYKRIDDLVSKTKKAMIYPASVMIALVSAIIVFMIFVLPPIMDVLKDMDVELPQVTIFLINATNFLKTEWLSIIIGLLLVVAGIISIIKNRNSKFLIDWILIRIPIIGKLAVQLHMTYFLRYFSLMLAGGIDIMQSVNTSALSVTNLAIQYRLIETQKMIMEGDMISQAFKRLPFLPNTVIRMIAVGETSGNLPEQMDYLAELYNEKLERLLDAAFAVFEPIIIFVMAILAGTIIFAVLGPVYNMIGNLQETMTSAGGM